LAFKLKSFRKGEVNNQQAQMMVPFAQPLSDLDIELLSTFLHDFVDDQKVHYDPEYETWGDGGS
jgi:cytochrome c553